MGKEEQLCIFQNLLKKDTLMKHEFIQLEHIITQIWGVRQTPNILKILNKNKGVV